MELAPCLAGAGQVVKASSGHFPQPFLIRDYKELPQRYGRLFEFAKYFFLKVYSKDRLYASPNRPLTAYKENNKNILRLTLLAISVSKNSQKWNGLFFRL